MSVNLLPSPREYYDVRADTCFNQVTRNALGMSDEETVGTVEKGAFVIIGGAAVSLWFQRIKQDGIDIDISQDVYTIKDYDIELATCNGLRTTYGPRPHDGSITVNSGGKINNNSILVNDAKHMIQSNYEIPDDVFERDLQIAVEHMTIGSDKKKKLYEEQVEKNPNFVPVVDFELSSPSEGQRDDLQKLARLLTSNVRQFKLHPQCNATSTYSIDDYYDGLIGTDLTDDENERECYDVCQLVRRALNAMFGKIVHSKLLDLDAMYPAWSPHNHYFSTFSQTCDEQKNTFLRRYGLSASTSKWNFAMEDVVDMKQLVDTESASVLSIAHPRVLLGTTIDALSFRTLVTKRKDGTLGFSGEDVATRNYIHKKLTRRLNRVKAFLLASEFFLTTKGSVPRYAPLFKLGNSDPLRTSARLLLGSTFAKKLAEGTLPDNADIQDFGGCEDWIKI